MMLAPGSKLALELGDGAILGRDERAAGASERGVLAISAFRRRAKRC